MVTHALAPTRLPHPIQAGLAPAVLWLSARLIGMVAFAGCIIAIPGVIPDVRTGESFTSLAYFGVLAAVIIGVAASKVAHRAAVLRTPGALRPHMRADELSVAPTRIPWLTMNALETVVVAAAAYTAASRSEVNGSTPLLFGGLAGAFGVMFVARAAESVWNRDHWGLALDVAGLGGQFAAMAIVTFRVVADPIGLRGFAVSVGVVLALVGVVVVVLIRLATKGVESSYDENNGLTAELADLVTSSVDPAPTLQKRADMRLLVRAAIYAVAVVVVAAVLYVMFA